VNSTTVRWLPTADAVEVIFDAREFSLPEFAHTRYVLTPDTAKTLRDQLDRALQEGGQ